MSGQQGHQDADTEAAAAYLAAVRVHLDSAERAPTDPSRLTALHEARGEIEGAIEAQVRTMREHGASWPRIGACLGTTGAKAAERYDLIIDSGRGADGADQR
jgi:hypothetical protein